MKIGYTYTVREVIKEGTLVIWDLKTVPMSSINSGDSNLRRTIEH